MTLLANVNRPRSQEDTVGNWQPAHCLVGGVVSGAEIVAALCLLPLAVAHLPLGSQVGRVVNGSRLALIWYLLGRNLLFCEHTRGHLPVALGPSLRKVFFFFFVSLAFPQYELLCHFIPFRLSSGHLSLVLTLRTNDAACASVPSLHLLLVDGCEHLNHFSAGNCSFACILGCWLFSPQLCCPLRFQNSPLTPPVRVSYCVEDYPPSRLPPQDRSPSLNPLSFFSSFVFCPISFQRDWFVFLGIWCPPPVFISCFVEVAPHSYDLLMNLWRRRWSPHPIRPPSWYYLLTMF